MQKLLADKRLSLELTDAAKGFLAERGYDPTYGARPLKRAVQKYLMDPLALKVLGSEYVAGDIIQVDLGKDALTFGKGQAKAA
jgi:ATP-dependent Clp protease ATP-binding subunit ClpB